VGEELVDVFGEHVDFEVYGISGGGGGEVGDGPGVGGDPGGGGVVAEFGGGEADAVDGDGAAGDEEAVEVRGNADGELIVLAAGFPS
jgi:hypothetical protein